MLSSSTATSAGNQATVSCRTSGVCLHILARHVKMPLRFQIPLEGIPEELEHTEVLTVDELGADHLNIPEEFVCVIWFATVTIYRKK